MYRALACRTASASAGLSTVGYLLGSPDQVGPADARQVLAVLADHRLDGRRPAADDALAVYRVGQGLGHALQFNTRSHRQDGLARLLVAVRVDERTTGLVQYRLALAK